MLKLLIMGPAGSGKGTMSSLIKEHFPVAHISTGDMFREEIKQNTSLGQQANSYISKGLLVPDDVTIAMVKSRLTHDDCQEGYLLDGFPRSIVQAQAIDELGINGVINLTIDESLLVDRIVYRRVCKKCGATYNLKNLPPKNEGVCDRCGSQLKQRSDDTYEKLMVRLDSYQKQTKPVVEFFRDKNVVYDIDASRTIEEIYADIEKTLTKIREENR